MKQLSIFDENVIEKKSKKPLKKVPVLKLYIDGAARNNPGPAGAGIYITRQGKLVEKKGFYLGSRTNNQAEYFALLLGIYFLKLHCTEHDLITIISDSQLLVRQFKGEYKIKHPELKPLHALAQTMLKGIHYTIEHVMREDNMHADAMANIGIDKRIAMPAPFKKLLATNGLS